MNLKIPYLKHFTPAALRRWEGLEPNAQVQILNNAWCGVCRKTTHIQVRSAKIDRGDLLLSGLCGRCAANVARIVEKE
jgi:hypothetical protein